MLRLYLLPALLAWATAASAQTIEIRSNQPSMTSRRVEQVRITLGVSTFVPAPTDNNEEALKAQETGRRMIYQLAAHECAILLDMLASECRVESVNINAQRMAAGQFGGQQKVDGFNINGNISFGILQK